MPALRYTPKNKHNGNVCVILLCSPWKRHAPSLLRLESVTRQSRFARLITLGPFPLLQAPPPAPPPRPPVCFVANAARLPRMRALAALCMITFFFSLCNRTSITVRQRWQKTRGKGKEKGKRKGRGKGKGRKREMKKGRIKGQEGVRRLCASHGLRLRELSHWPCWYLHT